jgi:hypothetical protein
VSVEVTTLHPHDLEDPRLPSVLEVATSSLEDSSRAVR